MILTGTEIARQREAGEIDIDPFNPDNLGPNSYDVTLGPKLLVYDLPDGGELDMRRPTPTREIIIGPKGYRLEPGTLYLGSTVETAVSKKFVPLLEGRSSVGRLGINTHITAGFGDIGWGYDPDAGFELTRPTWTLEMEAVHPVRIYAGVRIAQVYFLRPEGTLTFYRGKYNRQRAPEASKMAQDAEAETPAA